MSGLTLSAEVANLPGGDTGNQRRITLSLERSSQRLYVLPSHCHIHGSLSNLLTKYCYHVMFPVLLMHVSMQTVIQLYQFCLTVGPTLVLCPNSK